MTKTPLPNGHRIQITSEDKDLSKEFAEGLVREYKKYAGPAGQVTVHKPSNLKVFGDDPLPFCTFNFDDDGIIFNTDFHS